MRHELAIAPITFSHNGKAYEVSITEYRYESYGPDDNTIRVRGQVHLADGSFACSFLKFVEGMQRVPSFIWLARQALDADS